ncbi:MAG: prephenate dehydrogenase [Dehalococcoidia bacterium]|nr:prephenate dehydrogenase [Dehalococcoidia bacterium]
MQITIIGLGHVGSSLGMALRAAYHGKGEVVGYDADPKTHNEAKKSGAVDRTEWNMDDAVRGSDMVVVAVPASAVRDIFEAVGPHLKEGAVVTDTTATKRQVLAWADELLPATVGFVGGNPLVGGGKTGAKDASPAIFQGAKYAVVASPKSPQAAVASVVKMIEDIGAQAFFLDRDEHDSFIAAMTGLPVVVEAALMLAAAKSPSWREISRFLGDEFKNSTTLAGADPAVTHGMIRTNTDMMTHWIEEMIAQLQQIKGMVEDESRDDSDGPLMNALIAAWEARARMEAGIGQSDTLREAMPTASDGMMQMFLGSGVSKMMKRTEKVRDPHEYDRRRLT